MSGFSLILTLLLLSKFQKLLLPHFWDFWVSKLLPSKQFLMHTTIPDLYRRIFWQNGTDFWICWISFSIYLQHKCSNNLMALRGTRSSSAATEISLILNWVKFHVPTLLAVFIPEVPAYWRFPPDLSMLGMSGCQPLCVKTQSEVGKFATRSKHPWPEALDALVALWHMLSL